MRARVVLVLAVALSACATISVQHFDSIEPKSDIRVLLTSEYIECSLSDIVVFSAPVVRDALYFLTRPDGRVTRLNITRPIYRSTAINNRLINTQHDSIVIKQESVLKPTSGVFNHKVFDWPPDSYGDVDLFEDRTRDLNHDFLIGPLLEDDHGNWCLSLYYQDLRGKWIEMYQVITLEISENVPSYPKLPVLSPGETFEFSFAYSIPGLQSCELRAPKSTFDRFYERDMRVHMDRCGYSIRNVTSEDTGYWSITGVGGIVYRTQVYLEIRDPEKIETRKRSNSSGVSL